MKNNKDNICPFCDGKQYRCHKKYKHKLLCGIKLIIRNVPTIVCNDCGEEFLDAEVSEITTDAVVRANRELKNKKTSHLKSITIRYENIKPNKEVIGDF